MESKIRRKSKTHNFTMFTATASCDTLPMFDMAGGVLEDGAVVKITLAASTADGRVYAMPDEVFAAQYVKFVSATTNSTGTVGTVMFKG